MKKESNPNLPARGVILHYFKFEKGVVLKDKITGFKGIVMARSDYYTGCNSYGLLSQKLKDGKPVNWEWIDEGLLELCSGKKLLKKSEKPNGGPHLNAPQM